MTRFTAWKKQGKTKAGRTAFRVEVRKTGEGTRDLDRSRKEGATGSPWGIPSSPPQQAPSFNAGTSSLRKEKGVCGKTFAVFSRAISSSPTQPQTRNPVPLGPEYSEAKRVRRRRNSHHRAVFGEAGNGAMVGISELAEMGRFELPRAV